MSDTTKRYKLRGTVVAGVRLKPDEVDDVTPVIHKKLREGGLSKEKAEMLEKAFSQLTRMFPNGHKQRRTVRKSSSETKLAQLYASIPIPDELPDLPEHLREFAFRYATEVRNNSDWARIHRVSIHTIRNWLFRPTVAQYILKIRRERQLLLFERLLSLELKAYKKLDEILSLPTNGETAEVLRKTALDVITITKNGRPYSAYEGVAAERTTVTERVFRESEPLDVDELKEQLDELQEMRQTVFGESVEAEYEVVEDGDGESTRSAE